MPVATGGYFGARLAQAGRDITCLVRERRSKQLQENGLVLRPPQGVEKLQLAQAGALNDVYDLIILTVKNFGLTQAMDDIAPAVGEQTLIMPILNGMRHMIPCAIASAIR